MPDRAITPEKINLASDEKAGLLIRHARRYPILTNADTTKAQLTPEGKTEATKFGELFLSQETAIFYTSPIYRCQQTADYILRGMDIKEDEIKQRIIVDKMLANAYIEDFDRAKIEFDTRDPGSMVLDFTSGVSIPGLGSIPWGAQRLLSFVKQRMQPGKITFFITHDALIMPFLKHYTGIEYNQENWIDFLDGAIIKESSTGISINNTKITVIPQE